MSILELANEASLDGLDAKLDALLKEIEVPEVEQIEKEHREKYNGENRNPKSTI